VLRGKWNVAQKAKSRRPAAARAAITPHGNGTNGSNGKNGFHEENDDPPLLGKNHPLAHIMGSYKDDPFWDEFVQLMKDARREQNERDFKELDRSEAEEREAAKKLGNE